MNTPVYDQSGFYMVIASIVVGICSHYNIIVGQSEALNFIVAIVAIIGTTKQANNTRNNAIAGGYHPSTTK